MLLLIRRRLKFEPHSISPDVYTHVGEAKTTEQLTESLKSYRRELASVTHTHTWIEGNEDGK